MEVKFRRYIGRTDYCVEPDPRTLIPLLFGIGAGLLFLRLLAHTHLHDRALLELCRQAVALRERQEGMEQRIGTAPLLPRYRRFEKGIRDLLAREGLKLPGSKP